MPKERFKVICAIFLILVRDGKVLLLKRANSGYMDGWYSLPAGHHDGGQTMMQAMCREAREEIGLSLSVADLEFAHVMHREKADDGERVDFYFTCKDWKDEPVNKEPEKCAALDWFPVDALPENIIPCVKRALESALRGEKYSEGSD